MEQQDQVGLSRLSVSWSRALRQFPHCSLTRTSPDYTTGVRSVFVQPGRIELESRPSG